MPFFTELYSNWYTKVDGKTVKILPFNIFQILTPRAFAYWLAGDAHYDKTQGVIIICTDSFTISEVDQLREILLTKYDIETTRVLSGSKSRDQYRIRIARREVIKVQNTVRDFFPSMMKHRVGL
jgi:hypothetical protein